MMDYTELIAQIHDAYPEVIAFTDIPHMASQSATAIEALQARNDALERLMVMDHETKVMLTKKLNTALARLEALEKQAPVGEAMPYSGKSADHTEAIFQKSIVPCGTKLYASPVPAKKLSDDQIRKALAAWFAKENESTGFEARMHAAIETALKGGA